MQQNMPAPSMSYMMQRAAKSSSNVRDNPNIKALVLEVNTFGLRWHWLHVRASWRRSREQN